MPAECFPTTPSRTAAQSCSRAPARNPPVALSKPAGCTTRRSPVLVSEVFLQPCGALSFLGRKIMHHRTKKRNGRATHCQRGPLPAEHAASAALFGKIPSLFVRGKQ